MLGWVLCMRRSDCNVEGTVDVCILLSVTVVSWCLHTGKNSLFSEIQKAHHMR